MKMSIIVKVFREGHSQIAELCKGSTADSDSVCEGSNPSPAATKVLKPQGFRTFLYFPELISSGSFPAYFTLFSELPVRPKAEYTRTVWMASCCVFCVCVNRLPDVFSTVIQRRWKGITDLCHRCSVFPIWLFVRGCGIVKVEQHRSR